jgi:choline dehydrogenase
VHRGRAARDFERGVQPVPAVSDTKSRIFDVVVVGGGSSGCVVAHTLSQVAHASVALVEAGPDYGLRGSGRWPADLLDARRFPLSHDWGYVEERDKGSPQSEPRARVIGGCSAHNQTAAIWPPADDFDRWALAAPSWSYPAIRPLFDRIEDADPPSLSRGQGGPLRTRVYANHELGFWQRGFVSAALAAGHPQLADLSDAEPSCGAAPFHVNADGPTRINTAFAFIDPIRERRNLTILASTVADRLIVEDGLARGLIVLREDERLMLEADRFVISSGVYGTPPILLRSGIGAPEDLTPLDIPVRVKLPGVGRGLQDHPGVPLLFGLTELAQREQALDAQLGRDYQSQVALRTASGKCPSGFDLHVLPYRSEEGDHYILAHAMRPRSRGRVSLRSSEANDPPRIQLGFLSDTEGHDIRTLTDGVHVARRIAKERPFSELIATELEPGIEANETELERFIRDRVTGYAHAVGTCRMGSESDQEAVVDETGRLFGLTNVYVADASIIPSIPAANPNLLCMLIGLKVATGLKNSLDS